ncbi:MAG TPA: glycosyltransferase family 4 protein [Nitrospirota bacterium]|nr:glycosyltransferase family 4 protein [Nitrospirota bacterium]
MKIAFAHMYTLRNPRGIERFIISVANGLAKKGHDVTLITGRCMQPVTREWIDERVRVCEIYHYNWHKLSFIPGFMKAFLTTDYDIVNLAIARGEGYAAGLAHMLKKFRYNIVFQYPFEEHEKHFNAFKKFGTAKYADKLVAASTYIALGVERCFNRPAITIPNGVDPDLFHPDISRRVAMREKLKIPEKAPVIITVAALQGRKGIGKVLKIVSLLKKSLPDIRYIVCGDGNEKDRQTFFGEIKSMGLEANVLFMGNQKDVSGFYNAADLFVFFPEFEGFGIVAIEAMASELPVVVSQGSAFPEILSQGGGLMVEPSAPAFAAEEIRALLINPSRMKQLGKEGRDSVLKKYSWDAVASEFEHLFAQQLQS